MFRISVIVMAIIAYFLVRIFFDFVIIAPETVGASIAGSIFGIMMGCFVIGKEY